MPTPFFNQARNGWVTPIGSLSNLVVAGVPNRSRSLDTGLSNETKLDEHPNQPPQINEVVIPDTSDSEHDDVMEPPDEPPPPPPPVRPTSLATMSTPPLVIVQHPSPTTERPSRRDRNMPLVRTKSKAAQTIVAAINQATGTRKTRRSTADDESPDATTPTGSAKFVDRCVTKMKTLINK